MAHQQAATRKEPGKRSLDFPTLGIPGLKLERATAPCLPTVRLALPRNAGLNSPPPQLLPKQVPIKVAICHQPLGTGAGASAPLWNP